MTAFPLCLSGETLLARPSGALYWPAQSCLVVSDLHLGRSDRYARRAGALLPPYEIDDTLARLDAEIAAETTTTVICLGDSFDDADAAQLSERHRLWLARLQAGRRWVWITGNHDPGPVDLAGTYLAEFVLGPLTFRHIAKRGAEGEVSGHYHPKVGFAGRFSPSFLADRHRIIMPAFGTYTGGMRSADEPLSELMSADATAIVTGRVARAIPMPR
ncbi:MAG: ligase-associated DNA damage response endonuclease PdeM [Rhodobacteraceae bacterium]|nr:ligase-associated DNA damage response endonuclease PdeM [Paracoccaceae bacterium]